MGDESLEMERLVEEIKAELFSPWVNLSLPPSAYDTAWVAMVPHPRHPDRPMFPGCLDWIIRNQNSAGFWWAEQADCLAATLACIIALKTWGGGAPNIEQGLGFLRANTEKLLAKNQGGWFSIVFPGLLELAQARGLEINLPDACTDVVNDLFVERERILDMKENSSWGAHLQVELYLEASPSPSSLKKRQQLLLRHQDDEDGSLFHSPSATARAFMVTGNVGFMSYLKTVVGRCGHGVPPVYPIDDHFMKLCLVDHLERLGCGEHFAREIRHAIDHAYSYWIIKEQQWPISHDIRVQLYKDSLSFRVLRMHGHHVSPQRFCWFVHDEEILMHMEENYPYYLGTMYGVYRASHLLFPDEDDLEKAKAFSRRILQKAFPCDNLRDGAGTHTDLLWEIEHDMRLPWLARMDHLEHREYIERNRGYDLWLGKASSTKLSFPDIVIELAKKNFMMRQSIYKAELEELNRWSKDTGLSNMGFGREKTTYCYFATAASKYLPLKSDARKVAAKCGILVTIADDFFDEKGSIDELCCLTEAIKRWEGDNLSGHGKVIFDVLDDLVTDITLKSFNQHGYNVKKILQDIWRETFDSWLKESTWSKSNYVPSIKEYLDVGMVSIAIRAMVLPACYLTCPKLLEYSMNSCYNTITKLLMLSARLLNDIQSYQKEVEDGKLNTVLLYLKENPKADIKDSIAYINNILDRKEKEFLALVLSNGYSDMPKELKEFYLLSFKIFRMLFNTGNAFDSPTSLLHDIDMAIYNPLTKEVHNTTLLEAPSYALKKENIGQSNGLGSENVLLMKSSGHFGVNCNIPHDSRAVSFEIKQSLNLTKPKKFPILPYQSSNMTSAMSFITSRPLPWMLAPFK